MTKVKSRLSSTIARHSSPICGYKSPRGSARLGYCRGCIHLVAMVIRWCCVLLVALCAVSTLSQQVINVNTVPWWKRAIFYQVYPRSFRDYDGDGIGDLRGEFFMLSEF